MVEDREWNKVRTGVAGSQPNLRLLEEMKSRTKERRIVKGGSVNGCRKRLSESGFWKAISSVRLPWKHEHHRPAAVFFPASFHSALPAIQTTMH
jgi:hypothetical protein